MPRSASHIYKNKGWVSWGDWLGTGNIHPSKIKWESFKKSKNYARSLNLKSKVEWYKFYEENKFPNIPKNPQSLYKNKGWKGWKDFLGTKNK